MEVPEIEAGARKDGKEIKVAVEPPPLGLGITKNSASRITSLKMEKREGSWIPSLKL